jgi:hypothetical protein
VQPFGSERIRGSELAGAFDPRIPFCVVHFLAAASRSKCSYQRR